MRGFLFLKTECIHWTNFYAITTVDTGVLVYNSYFFDRKILIPYLIIEIKSGDGGNAQDVMTCSKKANYIRTLFPFSKYFYVITEEPARRVAFHGKSFDEVHSLNQTKNSEKWDVEGLVEKNEETIFKIK